MSKTDHAHIESAVYRVDKFVVPAAARQEFLERVTQTHQILRGQAGLIRDLILEQSSSIIAKSGLPVFAKNDAKTTNLSRLSLACQPNLLSPGEFNFVTVAQWRSEAVIADVRAAVAAFHKERGFDAQEMFTRLGIKADIGIYARIIE